MVISVPIVTSFSVLPRQCRRRSSFPSYPSKPVCCLHGGRTVDPAFPEAAVQTAALRFEESNRPDPLFIDPYAACFLPSADKRYPVPPPALADVVTGSCSPRSDYVLATKFIDDRLTEEMSRADDLRQVVLFTDGLDTRPYRLRWPRSTLIFEVSPAGVYYTACQKLQGVGAKLSRTCMLFHCPMESTDILEVLRKNGFSGNRPSFWILQGLPFQTPEKLEEILALVSSLAMKGCIFTGELPCCLVSTQKNITVRSWMDKTFRIHGFQVEVFGYDDLANKLQCFVSPREPRTVLFVARQLQLSDDQMEMWRMEWQRAEEEGDEDGFEDMLA